MSAFRDVAAALSDDKEKLFYLVTAAAGDHRLCCILQKFVLNISMASGHSRAPTRNMGLNRRWVGIAEVESLRGLRMRANGIQEAPEDQAQAERQRDEDCKQLASLRET